MLSSRGERLLAGAKHKLAGALCAPTCRFVAATGLTDARQARDALRLLERHLLPAMTPLCDPIMPDTIWDMTQNYGEWLPKVMRLQTAYFERRQSRAYQIAGELGLIDMLRSQSLHRLASIVAGRRLKKKRGVQALCYGAGDYTGPHNDHHPQEPDAAQGYIDVHLTLASQSVSQHALVYATEGHLQNIVSVNTLGGMTFYRLPFWHYTTPLVPRRGRAHAARRWVLLGTFLFSKDTSHPLGAW